MTMTFRQGMAGRASKFYHFHYHLAWYYGTMNVTIDKAGRIVVPKAIRDTLHLKPGDEFDIEVNGTGFSLAPKPVRAKLVNRGGVWVRTTGHPSTYDVVEEIAKAREERHQMVLGHLAAGGERAER